MTMHQTPGGRNRSARSAAAAPRLFPPAFPFLLLPAGAVGNEPVALLPDSRIPATRRRLARRWARLVAQLRAAGVAGLPEKEKEALARGIWNILPRAHFTTGADFVIAWSGADVRGYLFEPEGELTCLWLACHEAVSHDEIDMGKLLDARLIDDPSGVCRRWKLAERIASVSWDGGFHAGGVTLYRTAAGYCVDWRTETGDVLGPYDSFSDALGGCGVGEGYLGEGLTFDIWIEPTHAGLAETLDALVGLSKDARGFWFNGVPMARDSRGLLRPLSDEENDLPAVP